MSVGTRGVDLFQQPAARQLQRFAAAAMFRSFGRNWRSGFELGALALFQLIFDGFAFPTSGHNFFSEADKPRQVFDRLRAKAKLLVASLRRFWPPAIHPLKADDPTRRPP